MFFLITALLLGAGFGSWFAPAEKRPWVVAVLAGTLTVGLVIYLIVPCIWLSGGTVMAETGWTWFGSGLYWARVVVGLAFPLTVVGFTRSIPAWLPVVILIGEIMGRMVFFKATLHAAGNIGGVY